LYSRIAQTFCLWLDPSLDIYTIKEKLVEHRRATGQTATSATFLSKDLFFICNGKPLSDEMLLSDYNFPENSTIHVSYRNRGGCFMVSLSILCIICASVIGSPCTCGLSLFMVPLLLPLLFILPFFCL
jgi:hypothetical protein